MKRINIIFNVKDKGIILGNLYFLMILGNLYFLIIYFQCYKKENEVYVNLTSFTMLNKRKISPYDSYTIL